ncbi:MAG: TIM barrel protein [Alphaproteobacteria bacterium]|nr:TIM barrel protein [Alphaproteobacteria bacterium]
MSRLLSLATGNLPEFSPVQVVEAAAQAGWPACGVWYDRETWTEQTTRDTRNAFERTGLVPFDMEVVWIRPGNFDPDHERLLAAGGEIGVRNALMVSSDPDMDATKRRFEELCKVADRYGINACFEFLPITDVKTLQAALDILRSVGHPRGKLLVDALHLKRSGGDPSMLRGLPADLVTYAQICDAPAELPDMEFQTILDEAVDGRLLPGEGALPLHDMLAALPQDLPLAPEQRSKPLRDQYPDAADRAKAILDATQRFLEG